MLESNRQPESTQTNAHTVLAGENLWSIAKAQLSLSHRDINNRDIANTVNSIIKENHLNTPNRIRVNENLNLPALELYETNGSSTSSKKDVLHVHVPTSRGAEVVAASAQPYSFNAEAPTTQNAIKEPHQLLGKNDLDFLESWASGAIGRGLALRLAGSGGALLEHAPNPWVKAAGYVGASIVGAIAARESIDLASHAILHTERHSATEIVAQGVAGSAGTLIGRHLPNTFGKNAGGFAEAAITSGAQFSALNAGSHNPFVHNDKTGKNYTVGESGIDATGAFISGAAWGATGHYTGKIASKVAKSTWSGLTSTYKGVASHF